jgi:hypothetical protein
MNTKQIIEEAKKNISGAALSELIQEFEEFTQTLMHLHSLEDEKQKQLYMEKMGHSHDRLSAYFMRVSASFGMTVEQFSEFVSNPNNFEPSDWEEIQDTKKEILDRFSAQGSKNKNKKTNKTLKI